MDLIKGAMFMVRLGQLSSLCQEHGLEFSPIWRDSQMESHYPHFPCLSIGHDRFAYNIMTGDHQGYPFTAFDYHYQTRSRTHSRGRPNSGSSMDRGQGLRISWGDTDEEVRDHEFSAVILETSLPLRSLSLRPTNMIMRGISDFFGTSGVQFELTEFNNQFHVEAEDPRWAYDLLSQSTMELLLKSPQYILQIEAGQVIAFRKQLFAPEDFFPALNLISGILERVPADVMRELQEP